MERGIIITRTPFRVSFFGGGTDFPEYYNQFGALIIGAAINKYLYVSINSLERLLGDRIRLSYSKLEFVNNPRELEHEIVRVVLSEHLSENDYGFLDIHTFADLPASCGLSSSSAFTAGLLNALYLLKGIHKDKKTIAREAIEIERIKIKNYGGHQDQIFASYGGFNRIYFRNNDFLVEPICLSSKMRNDLERACLLFFTGKVRNSSAIQQKAITSNFENKIPYLTRIQSIAEQANNILCEANSSHELIEEWGKLLHASWEAKKNLSDEISNPTVDGLYEKALKAGALGGKLCGAGESGFLLLMVHPETRNKVIAALAPQAACSFTFENFGTQPIHLHRCEPLMQESVMNQELIGIE